MINYNLVEEVLGYATAEESTNTDPRYIVAGSQNVLIDYQKKISTRRGYSRLGAANTSLTPVRGATTWNSSTGLELPVRMYDDELEVYLGTIDGTDIDAWTRITSSLSTTLIPRFTTWWDATENLDLLLYVLSDANIYEWGGGVAVVDSITGTTVTKAGTNTFAQNRFYTSRNMTFICVRTGTEYTYTGGAGTTTLTGIADTAGLVAGDTLIQKVVTQSNKPAASHQNDTIGTFENQLIIGSSIDNEVWISQNDDYDDFTYSAPRIAGEGSLLTLDAPSGGFAALSNILLFFSGRSSIFKAKYQEITVGSTLTETLTVDKLKSGVDQSAQSPDTIVPVGNAIIYLSHEPALRFIQQPDEIQGPQLKTLSNPIKPDFDGETWTNAQGIWFKNAFYLCAPASSKLYILEFKEDADGNVRRFWQAPQILPVRRLAIISDALHGHSNGIPETYELFADGVYSDVDSSDNKIPINAIAAFAYNDFKKRANLKTFDEYDVEGYILPSTTDLITTIRYDYGGYTQSVEKTVDGSDEDILEETVDAISLGQAPLGQEPIGGSLDAPSELRKFHVIFEIAREDFHRIQARFSTNEVDRYWSIISHGPNATISPRRTTLNKK